MTITENDISRFESFLKREEHSKATIEKYVRNVREFSSFAVSVEITKGVVIAWKEYLLNKKLKASTVNSKLIALNRFFQFCGAKDVCVKTLRIQRQVFRQIEKELSQEEYRYLVKTAISLGKERTAMLFESICATGIRVSEAKYLTVETIKTGRMEISLKGKNRIILLPSNLCEKLQKYAKKQKIKSGQIFITKNGTAMDRRQIWSDMKIICNKAGITPTKVYPHNLRHLFARTFYTLSHDVVKLADLLGHSNVETTRIYLASTGKEHALLLEHMGLVS